MFLSLDGTFWIQLLNFALFFALLNVVFLRPVGAAIKKRRAYIDGVQSDYERYARQVQGVRSESEQLRAAARREAEETVHAARSAADGEAASGLERETARATSLIDEAHATVASEMRAAKAREGELSERLGRTLLERAIGAGS